jgi:hypothetical protein
MRTFDQLVALTKAFTLEKIMEWTPELGATLETFYLDEESEEDDESGVSVADDLKGVRRRSIALDAMLHAHERDIAWLYDQVEKIAFEAKATRR